LFQIKDFASISASILNYAKAVGTRITDFSIGSGARTMLEAPAIEIEELYQQMFYGLKESIPVAIYNSFDFTRLVAQSATGIVRVTITPTTVDTLIAANALFTSTALSTQFTALYDATIVTGGSYADVTIQAKIPGIIGNVAAGTDFTIQPIVNNIVSAIGLTSFVNGRELETDEQRKSRFASFILTLNHGTVAALRYGLSLVNLQDINGNITEYVRYASIIEPYLTDNTKPIALVNVYVHNGISGASGNLITQAQKILYGYTDANGNIISGWQAAGIHLDVYAATNITINITATIVIDSHYVSSLVKTEVQSTIADYIANQDIGTNIYLSEIIAAAMGVTGVINFTLITPATDTAVSNTQKAMIGTFTA
jgi:uncharacterized phage protein gp47/JayE